MNNIELIERLRRQGITVTSVAVDFFYTKPLEMNREESHMWKPNLLNVLRIWSNQMHGKEPDRNIAETIAKKIKKEYGHLSVSEVQYCLDRVVNGDEEIPREYNLQANSVLKLLKVYNAKKMRIKREYYKMKQEESDAYEAQGAIQNFLNQAKEKYNQGEELTIYERSVLGKELAKTEETEVLNNISQMVEENKEQLKNQEKKRLGNLFCENIPVSINDEILFNAVYFDHKQR